MAKHGKHANGNGRSQHRGNRKGKGPRRKAPPVPRGEVRYSAEEYQELKAELDLNGDWDVVLVGDGSARDRAGSCGWAVTLYDRAGGTKRVFYGGCSEGSCVLAELVPYVQALLWYARFRRGRREGSPTRVVIATDSQILANQGAGLARFMADPKRLRGTRPFWQLLHQMAEDGRYAFDWRWRRRGTLRANREMNLLAQSVRWRLDAQREHNPE